MSSPDEGDTPYDPPDEQPQIDAAAVAYGWLKVISAAMNQAADDLATYVPDDQEDAAVARAYSRAAALVHGIYTEGDE